MLIMMQGVGINFERLSKKYDINYDMAKFFAPLFSTKFMELVEDHMAPKVYNQMDFSLLNVQNKEPEPELLGLDTPDEGKQSL